MTINERMNHIIKELYGGNKRAFANAIGVSATVIENVVGILLLFNIIIQIKFSLSNLHPYFQVLG